MAQTDEIHALTVAEIGRLTGEYTRRRRAATEERAALYAAREAGAPEPDPLTEHDAAVREKALQMLNGYAPSSMRLLPPIPRDEELIIEVAAIDIVLGALSQQELTARATAAAAWIIAYGDAWRQLCRDIILTATRLQAPEARPQAGRPGPGGVRPATV